LTMDIISSWSLQNCSMVKYAFSMTKRSQMMPKTQFMKLRVKMSNFVSIEPTCKLKRMCNGYIPSATVA